MIDVKNYLKFIRYFLIILIFSKGFRMYNISKVSIILLIASCLMLIINDLIRSSIRRYNNLWYYLSLTLSMIGASALRYYINSFIAYIFLFYYAVEILYINTKFKQLFLVFHSILYFTTVILSTGVLTSNKGLSALGTSILSYACILSVLYLSHSMRLEREETKKLNEKLKESNIKLQEYSLKVEELSIAKERERVAQELHDSLGHSLMALTMHLEFAEKVFHADPKKSKEVILKAKSIAKDSTASLRMAVNTLKEERNIEDLKNAVMELIHSFEIIGNIKIELNMDKHLEALNPDVKLCIYKTIRESLTNGIKHGRATAFNLKIGINKSNVNLDISNNGIGSNTIIKSNGLKGIENRIAALGGSVDFKSSENGGFTTRAEIPIYEEANGID